MMEILGSDEPNDESVTLRVPFEFVEKGGSDADRGERRFIRSVRGA